VQAKADTGQSLPARGTFSVGFIASNQPNLFLGGAPVTAKAARRAGYLDFSLR
jgi:hypothetical protein